MERSRTNKLVVKPGAVVEFVKTTLKGEITIGKGTVVHPTVQILAEGGPIIIGANNLFEEGVVIHNPRHPDSAESRTMVIGDNNHFEVRSHSEASSIGNNNILQMTAKIGSDVKLGDGCVVGVGTDLKCTDLADKTQIYTHNGMIHQRVGGDTPQLQSLQLEYLRNMIPNYHKIHKPTKVEAQ